MMKEENVQKLIELAKVNAIDFGIKILVALIILIIGFKVISLISKGIEKIFEKRKVEKTVSGFIGTIFNILLKVALLISIAGYIGIETTSFAAILASFGLAVGMALQGSLSNFAGGVMIILFRPYKVGDYIEAQGESGTVREVKLFNTILATVDNKIIYLPNGPVASGNITNYSSQSYRRVDLVFGIGYSDDLKKAKEILTKIADEDPRILKEHASTIGVLNLGESSVDFAFRVHVKTSDYWPVFFDMQEKVKLTFDAQGISIPFPQRDIHIHNA